MEQLIQDLREELSNSFAVDTMAHDIKKGKAFEAKDYDDLAESYIELRKLAYQALTTLT